MIERTKNRVLNSPFDQLRAPRSALLRAPSESRGASRVEGEFRIAALFILAVALCLCGDPLLADTASKNPASDDAVSGTWDGTAGSRYTVVNDHPDSSGSTFLTHGTTTAGDLTFGYSAFSVPAGASSISVQVIYYDQKTASQACNIGGRLKVGGNYYNASTHNPANGIWTLRTDNWATNPKSAANWTADDVNGVGTDNLQAFGWVSTDANPAIRLSSIIVQVTYTPPGGRKRSVVIGGILGARAAMQGWMR